jgi:hypothetical protein
VSHVLVFRKFSRPRQACVDHWANYSDAVRRMKRWQERHGRENKWMIAECDKAFDAFEAACTRELEDLNR